jgi:hypothetical protein
MRLFKSMVHNPDRTTYEGKDNDEQILYIIRRSLWSLVPCLFSIAILTIIPVFLFPYLYSLNIQYDLNIKSGFISALNIFWYLFTFGYLFEAFITWYFNVFVITSKKIIDFDIRGLTYKNTSETALRNVEDVTSRVSGTLGTILNIGEVFVQTAAEQREFEFSMMDNPAQIRDIISDLISNLKNGEQKHD